MRTDNNNTTTVDETEVPEPEQGDEETTEVEENGDDEATETESDTLTPIQVAKLAGVRPQMVYNYISNKLIPAHRNDAGKWAVNRADAEAWVAKYTARKAERVAAAEAKVAEELAGAGQ
jgi:hypothetical protein